MAIICESGLPDGSVNLLLGAGEAGKVLVASDGIEAISFTGSSATGASVLAAAAARSVRVQLEMGGVNGLIVMADADLDDAVDCAVNGAFLAAGQRCTATSRIIVEEAIADRFVERLCDRATALRIGDPCEESTQIGPLASRPQKERVVAQVRQVERLGLEPVIGGSARPMDQCFFPPTLFDHVEAHSPLVSEEIFGPVAGVFRVGGFDEAIATLNHGRFGLSAGICTRSLLNAEEFKRRARAGMLMVNLPTAGVDYHAPFGGSGASSYGPREQGRAARAFYTSMTTSYQKPL
jgi:aldehyde dehydrogenase (NAD+)